MIGRSDLLSRAQDMIGEMQCRVSEGFDTPRTFAPLAGAGSAEGLNTKSE
jgi:hypothetical protein